MAALDLASVKAHLVAHPTNVLPAIDIAFQTSRLLPHQLAGAGLIERRRKAGSFVRRPHSQSAVLDIPEANEFLDLTAGSFQAGTWWPTIIAQQVREFIPSLF